MAREIVFQYNGIESHRESPILDSGDSFIVPNADEIIARRGTHYRVRSVKHFEVAGLASRCIVDIAPIYPLERRVEKAGSSFNRNVLAASVRRFVFGGCVATGSSETREVIGQSLLAEDKQGLLYTLEWKEKHHHH